MSSSAALRLMSDLRAVKTEPPEGCSAAPHSDDNLFVWAATVLGPDDTSWEGGVFMLRMTFTESYPDKPPRVRFTSEVFHPNVYADGTLCMNVLQEQWSPINTICSLLAIAKGGREDVYALRRFTPPREDLGVCVLSSNVQNGDNIEYQDRAWVVQKVSAHYALRQGKYRRVETRLHVVETGRWLVNEYLEGLLQRDTRQ